MAGSVSVKVTQSVRIQAPTLPASAMVVIGGVAIDSQRDRIDEHRGIDDAPLQPYSPKGPIYAPVTGMVAGRTKVDLKGKNVFTRNDVYRAKKAGMPLPLTGSKKSAKFANWAEYKKSLGKSGERDLEVSGQMLGAIQIVESGKDRVAIGFSRDSEEKKAQGNQDKAEWYGLSPTDQAKVMQAAEPFIAEATRQMVKPSTPIS